MLVVGVDRLRSASSTLLLPDWCVGGGGGGGLYVFTVFTVTSPHYSTMFHWIFCTIKMVSSIT